MEIEVEGNWSSRFDVKANRCTAEVFAISKMNGMFVADLITKRDRVKEMEIMKRSKSLEEIIKEFGRLDEGLGESDRPILFRINSFQVLDFKDYTQEQRHKALQDRMDRIHTFCKDHKVLSFKFPFYRFDVSIDELVTHPNVYIREATLKCLDLAKEGKT